MCFAADTKDVIFDQQKRAQQFRTRQQTFSEEEETCPDIFHAERNPTVERFDLDDILKGPACVARKLAAKAGLNDGYTRILGCVLHSMI